MDAPATLSASLRPVLVVLALACAACPGDDTPRTTSTDPDTGSTGMTGITTLVPDTDDGATSIDPDTTVGDPDTSGGDTDVPTTDTDSATSGDTDTTTDGGPVCGNGVLEDGEACDTDELGGEDCGSQGFPGGELLCAKDCTLDTNGCVSRLCGNDVIEGSEQCDGTSLGGATCVTEGFSMGELGCTPGCAFDTSGCSNPMCGNDVVEMGEACDGVDLAGESCLSQGFPGGTLGCLGDCSAYDTTACDCYETDIGGAMGAAVAMGNTDMEDNDLDGSCGGGGGNDHVVRFTAPFAGTFAFDTSGSDYDTKLSLFSDCATELTCNDDAGGTLQSLVTLDMVAGQTVNVVVDGFNGSTGNWVLNINPPAVCGDGSRQFPEICDGADLNGQDCTSLGFTAGSVVCTGTCDGFDTAGCFNGPVCADQDIGNVTGLAVAAGNTTGDDDDLNPSCGGGGGNDNVMVFTATGAGTYSFNTYGSAYDTKVSLWSDCATETTCNDDAGGTVQSRTSLAMAAGQQVLVAVDGFGGGVGDWVLNIAPPFACEDEDVGSTVASPATSGNTSGADNDLDPSCGAGNASDQVIRFTAPATASYTFNTAGSGYDTVMALWSNCATQLACNDDAAGLGLQSLVQRNMTAGETVLVLIDGFNGASGAWTLNVTSP